MANVDPPLMQQILDVLKREWEPDIEHYRQANYFGRRFEVLEWAAFGHPRTLDGTLPGLKPSLSGKTTEAAFIPALSGIRVEMLGGSHFVWANSDALSREVAFDAEHLDSLAKVLINQATKTDVRLEVLPNAVVLRCGSSKVTIPRKLKAKRKT